MSNTSENATLPRDAPGEARLRDILLQAHNLMKGK